MLETSTTHSLAQGEASDIKRALLSSAERTTMSDPESLAKALIRAFEAVDRATAVESMLSVGRTA